jgi:hypothetical protein
VIACQADCTEAYREKDHHKKITMTSPSAGFVERLFYSSLAADLRAGKMRTIVNGTIVCETHARRLVAHAQRNGWLDIPTLPNDRAPGRPA